MAATGKGKGDGGGIDLLAAFLKVEAETRENPIVIDNYDLPDDDDDEDMVIMSSTSDEKKSAGRKIKIKTSIAKSQGIYGNTYEWPKNDFGKGAEHVFKQRYEIRNEDACALLAHGGTFVKDHEGRFHLVFGDVPSGYFRGLPHDVRFSRTQAVVILMSAKQVLHKEGTIIIRIGEYDKEMWRSPRSVVCTVSGMLMSWYTTRRGQEKRPTVPEPSRTNATTC